MLDGSPPTSATFAAGNSETELRIPTKGDSTVEDDSTVTVSIQASSTYRREANDAAKATTTILDDDAAAPPGGTSGSAGTTVWSADMSVTDYGNGSIGAGSASLLANQRGSEGLQAKWLYYHTGERKLRMSFTTNVDSGGLTVNAGGINLLVRHVIIFEYGHGLQRAIIDESQHRTPERLIMAQHYPSPKGPPGTRRSLGRT